MPGGVFVAALAKSAVKRVVHLLDLRLANAWALCQRLPNDTLTTQGGLK
jgi:hypothetical protein